MQDNALCDVCAHLSVKRFWAFLFVIILIAFYILAVPNVEAGYIIDEDFNTNSLGWDEENDNRKMLEIKDGKYFIRHNKEGSAWTSWIGSDINQFSDFTIETSIEWLSGFESSVHSVLWGSSNFKNYYGFGVNARGKFLVYKRENGVFYFFAGWTKSPHIAKNSVNTLSVSKSGNKLIFSINGIPVFEMPHMTFYGNKIGFQVGSSQMVAVDYLRVSQGIKSEESSSWEPTGITDNNDNCENAILFFSNAEKLMEDSPEKAREMFYQAMQLCPGSENAIYNYSLALYKTKYYKRAVSILERRIKVNGLRHTKMVELLIYIRLLRKENVTRGMTLASNFSEKCPGLDFAKMIFRDSLDHSSDELRAKYDKHFTLLPLESGFPTFTPSPATAGTQSSKKPSVTQGMSIFHVPEECNFRK